MKKLAIFLMMTLLLCTIGCTSENNEKVESSIIEEKQEEVEQLEEEENANEVEPPGEVEPISERGY